MTDRHSAFAALLAGGIVLSAADPLGAQSLGSFSWQLQPFCNNVTVNVTQQASVFTIDGYDDQCGAGQRAPLVGMATQNPDGTIGFGLHITVAGGRAVHVAARIPIATVSGTWSDSAGNSGTFAFNARTGGSPRPVPTIPAAALTPGSITAAQLAPSAVSTANLADGSVTRQKLSVPLPKLNWSGLTIGRTVLPEDTNVIVRTVTMAIPAVGQVMVNASGLFGFTIGGGFDQDVWCSISTGTAVESAQYLYARTTETNSMSNVPFAGTRVYNATPGTFTVNLVCTASSTIAYLGLSPTLEVSQLTALFVPN